MKKIIAILILCSMLLSITGCSNSNLKSENDTMNENNQKTNIESEQITGEEDEHNTDKEAFAPKKTTVTEVFYEEASPWFNNRILVKKAGRYGIIDNLGNIVMPITQPYTIQPLNMNAVKFLDNKKLGVLSLSGEVLVPAVYDEISAINDNIIHCKSHCPGIYDEKGEIYDTINKFYSVKKREYLNLEISGYVDIIAVGQNAFVISYGTPFSEVKESGAKIITFDGEMIDIDPSIDNDFSDAMEQDYCGIYDVRGYLNTYNDVTIYKTSNSNEYLVSYKHIMDAKGNTVIDFTEEDRHFIFNTSSDYCYSDEVIIAEFVRKEEYINYYNHYIYNLISHEKKKIEAIDDNTVITDVMSNNFYEISVWDKDVREAYCGIMNDKYEIVLEPIYDSVDDYVNGYCPIELNEYIGFVDEAGSVLAPQFPEENIVDDDGFTYLYNPPYGRGSLINPRTGEILPYEEADLKEHFEGAEKLGIFEAILTDADTGAKYKSFVTWDGPIVEHKFPNAKISLSRDGKVAVYNKGTLYTIVELQ